VTRFADRSRLTAAEYLAWERAQDVKHEFFHGEVFAMPGRQLPAQRARREPQRGVDGVFALAGD